MINFFHCYFSLVNVSNHDPEAEGGVEVHMVKWTNWFLSDMKSYSMKYLNVFQQRQEQH